MDSLKRTENFVAPGSVSLAFLSDKPLRMTDSFNIAKWLEINYPVAESVSLTKVGADGIKIATGGAQSTKVKVELTDEASLLALQEARARELEAIRVANALPSWIERSTVSGTLTEAGAKQALQEKEEASKGPAVVAPSSPVKESPSRFSNDDVSKDGTLVFASFA